MHFEVLFEIFLKLYLGYGNSRMNSFIIVLILHIRGQFEYFSSSQVSVSCKDNTNEKYGKVFFCLFCFIFRYTIRCSYWTVTETLTAISKTGIRNRESWSKTKYGDTIKNGVYQLYIYRVFYKVGRRRFTQESRKLLILSSQLNLQ